jgi:quinoprotein dehydrogenase-associated probable ABC transporter substrate-binding protein
LAELLAANMNQKLEYTWWSERKNFAKQSLAAGACDAVMGIPAGMEGVLTTDAYYRSTYVFVSRRDRNLQIASLADPRLANLQIGVHVVGDDLAPPAYALAHRGITRNVTGFSLFGAKDELNPARKLVEAVGNGSLDVAIVWGPIAGYFAQSEKVPLSIAPVEPPMFLGVPFTYGISAGVRPGNEVLRDKLNAILQSQSVAIRQILTSYDVPQSQ